jgi:hypothetical protein
MRLLREPLVHFLAIGALLFVLFRMAGDDAPATEEIVVTQGRIDQLATSFRLVWQRKPTPQELDGLIEDYIREEVLYREAVGMGLDRDDTIIRRRMRQKLEFLAEDLSAQFEPTDEDLQAWFSQHRESYRVDEGFTFRHIYLNPDRRGDDLPGDIERLLEQLSTATEDLDVSNLGDPLLLPDRYEAMARTRVEQTFGTNFATSLEEFATGAWGGPIESGYGQHLVLLHERKPGGIPELDDVRDRLQRDWSAARRQQTLDAHYQALRGAYAIRIEGARR